MEAAVDIAGPVVLILAKKCSEQPMVLRPTQSKARVRKEKTVQKPAAASDEEATDMAGITIEEVIEKFGRGDHGSHEGLLAAFVLLTQGGSFGQMDPFTAFILGTQFSKGGGGGHFGAMFPLLAACVASGGQQQQQQVTGTNTANSILPLLLPLFMGMDKEDWRGKEHWRGFVDKYEIVEKRSN
jgi:hypothetical protein